MEYLIKVSALILLLYLGYALFLKKETFFNHNRWFLLLGLVTAVILPLIVIPIYITVEPVSFVNTPASFVIENSAILAQETPFDWLKLVTFIYGIGVVICLIQFVLQFGSLLILLLKNAKNKDGIYTYVIVKNRISPFSFFKWIVYNPNLFSDDELQLIINHEKVHVRQWHSLDIIVSRLACVFLWFNPLMWLYHKDLQQNLEYIADENAQNSSNSKKDYQHLLLKTSVGDNNLNITSNFYNSLIKKRIVMLQKNRSKSVNRWKSIFILPLFVIFLMSFNTEEIFIEAEKTKTSIKLNSGTETKKIVGDSIVSERFEIIFTNTTTEESFTKFKTELEKRGVIMNLKTLKRNDKGIITKITIDFTSEHGSTKYSVMDNDGISNFYFRLDNGHKMSVGATNDEIIEVEEQEVIEIIEEPEVIEEIIEVIEESEDSIKGYSNTVVILRNGNTTKISGDSIRIIESNPKTKGKYIFRTKDSIVVGKPNTAYTFKSNGNVKVRSNKFVIKTDSISYIDEGMTPLYIIDGVPVTQDKLKKLNPNKIKAINVLKSKKQTKIYGKAGDNGVIVITSKDDAKKKNKWVFSNKVDSIYSYKEATSSEVKKFISSGKKPIIVIDNEVMEGVKIKDIDYDIAKSVSILKGQGAINLFGKKAKDGAVVVFTKDYKTDANTKYTVQVESINYVDDKDESKNSTLYYINANTTDETLKLYKSKLGTSGITAKFNRIKRDKSGRIITIKVSLSDKNGDKSSASFKNDDGIPKIAVGKKGNSLIASSSL